MKRSKLLNINSEDYEEEDDIFFFSSNVPSVTIRAPTYSINVVTPPPPVPITVKSTSYSIIPKPVVSIPVKSLSTPIIIKSLVPVNVKSSIHTIKPVVSVPVKQISTVISVEEAPSVVTAVASPSPPVSAPTIVSVTASPPTVSITASSPTVSVTSPSPAPVTVKSSIDIVSNSYTIKPVVSVPVKHLSTPIDVITPITVSTTAPPLSVTSTISVSSGLNSITIKEKEKQTQTIKIKNTLHKIDVKNSNWGIRRDDNWFYGIIPTKSLPSIEKNDLNQNKFFIQNNGYDLYVKDDELWVRGGTTKYKIKSMPLFDTLKKIDYHIINLYNNTYLYYFKDYGSERFYTTDIASIFMYLNIEQSYKDFEDRGITNIPKELRKVYNDRTFLTKFFESRGISEIDEDKVAKEIKANEEEEKRAKGEKEKRLRKEKRQLEINQRRQEAEERRVKEAEERKRVEQERIAREEEEERKKEEQERIAKEEEEERKKEEQERIAREEEERKRVEQERIAKEEEEERKKEEEERKREERIAKEQEEERKRVEQERIRKEAEEISPEEQKKVEKQIDNLLQEFYITGNLDVVKLPQTEKDLLELENKQLIVTLLQRVDKGNNSDYTKVLDTFQNQIIRRIEFLHNQDMVSAQQGGMTQKEQKANNKRINFEKSLTYPKKVELAALYSFSGTTTEEIPITLSFSNRDLLESTKIQLINVKYKVDNYNINARIVYRKDGYPDVIVKEQPRQDKNSLIVYNKDIKNLNGGRFFLIFDNSYSQFTAKIIHYDIYTI
jgi:hypothetical protein